jgi:acetolactate synthase I/II/III large subunit
MTDQLVTHADLIAASLAAEGVDRAYGLPGGEVVTLIEACRRREIEFHLVGHEASAAFMAATEGRITGRPGVCITTLGPGATNLGTGLAHAFLDREPLVAFSATLATTTDPGYTHQRLSLIDHFSGITKHSLLLSGQDTDETVRAALALARADRPGPVSLLLPSDVALAEARATSLASQREPAVDNARDRSGAPAALDGAAGLIADAARPLVIVGLGVNHRTAGAALSAFLDAGRYPVVTTPKIKGILSEEDPRWMGVVGGMAGEGQMRRLIDEADLLIAVGFDPVECDADWFVGRRVLAIDSVDAAAGGYRPVLSLPGDPAEALAGLARRVGTARGWDVEFLRGHQSTLRDIVSPHPTGDGGLSPAEVAQALRNILPRDGILTCDVGSHKLLLGQVWTTYEPLTFFMSNGLSSMGYGLPAAAAAQLCFPQRAVCCVTGDGGMLMTLHMLEYLRRKRLPVVTVVLTDQSLSLIRLAQERRGLRPTGVDFRAPAFATVAQGFGIEARRVSTIGELSRAFAAALEAREPWLLDVPVDAREYAVQM